jgi:hypothetical protein
LKTDPVYGLTQYLFWLVITSYANFSLFALTIFYLLVSLTECFPFVCNCILFAGTIFYLLVSFLHDRKLVANSILFAGDYRLYGPVTNRPGSFDRMLLDGAAAYQLCLPLHGTRGQAPSLRPRLPPGQVCFLSNLSSSQMKVGFDCSSGLTWCIMTS